jgi:hypothetical protein
MADIFSGRHSHRWRLFPGPPWQTPEAKVSQLVRRTENVVTTGGAHELEDNEHGEQGGVEMESPPLPASNVGWDNRAEILW